MNDMDAEFVFYTIHRDADAWGGVFGSFGGLWGFAQNGMLDENGNPRPTLKVWDAWLQLSNEN